MTLHDIAEEVNLWLGLAVNAWLVTTGALIFIRRPSTVEALRKAMTIATGLAFVMLGFAVVSFVVWDIVENGGRAVFGTRPS